MMRNHPNDAAQQAKAAHQSRPYETQDARPTVKQILRARANALRNAGTAYDQIADTLPEVLTPEQEQAFQFLLSSVQMAL